MQPKLATAVTTVTALGQTPNVSLSIQLKKNLETLVSNVEEITLIEDAQTQIVSGLRQARDKGLLLIIGLAALASLFLAAQYLGEAATIIAVFVSTWQQLINFTSYVVDPNTVTCISVRL
jgi:hypothetical protein